MTALAEYRRLESRDFLYSRLGSFGFWRHQKVRLARRPVRRMFVVGFAQHQYLDFDIMTTATTTERGAVHIDLCFYSVFGQKLAHRLHVLFADPAGNVAAQRLWFDKPTGAAFAVLVLRRTSKEARIGLEGQLKLRRARKTAVTDANIESSRDKGALEHSLDLALGKSDRALGRKLLARLIYLWQQPHHQRALLALDDAERLLAPAGRPARAQRLVAVGQQRYFYHNILSEKLPCDLPLSKWLRLEMGLLRAAINKRSAGCIEVGGGADGSGRNLAAAIVAAEGSLGLAVPEQQPAERFGWLSAAEIQALCDQQIQDK